MRRAFEQFEDRIEPGAFQAGQRSAAVDRILLRVHAIVLWGTVPDCGALSAGDCPQSRERLADGKGRKAEGHPGLKRRLRLHESHHLLQDERVLARHRAGHLALLTR